MDDEQDLLEFIQWQLESLEYKVHTALGGKNALKILKKEIIDIFIADIRMPDMDGIELTRRAIELCPDMQCIVMTGHGEIETAIEAMRLGAINYLRKPVGIDELEMAIQKGMEKAGLIQTIKKKQKSLEKANLELSRLRHELEKSLVNEIAQRKQAEKALNEAQIRQIIIELMNISLRYWKEDTKKTKIDLAEESNIWTVSLDKGGTFRTRTLDKYLRYSTIPSNPRYNDILDTGYFILSHCHLLQERKKTLKSKINELEQILLKRP